MLSHYLKDMERDFLEDNVIFEQLVQEQLDLGYIEKDEVDNSIISLDYQKSEEHYYNFMENLMYKKTKEL